MLNLVLKPNNNPIPNDTHPYLSNEKPHSDKNQPYMDPLTNLYSYLNKFYLQDVTYSLIYYQIQFQFLFASNVKYLKNHRSKTKKDIPHLQNTYNIL